MYYVATVKLEFETDKGHIKKKTEAYLVKAESVTDAEAIVHEKFKDYPQEFEVKSVSQSRIIDVYSA
jgi:Domain of unknown function (DUF4494)